MAIEIKLRIGLMIGLSLVSGLARSEASSAAPHAESMGWRLGVQAYSFNKLTFLETVERVAKLGLGYVEAYPGQRLSQETGALTFDHNLPPDMIPKVKAKLAERSSYSTWFGADIERVSARWMGAGTLQGAATEEPDGPAEESTEHPLEKAGDDAYSALQSRGTRWLDDPVAPQPTSEKGHR